MREFWTNEWEIALSSPKYFSALVPVSEFSREIPNFLIGKTAKINGSEREILGVEVRTNKIGLVVIR